MSLLSPVPSGADALVCSAKGCRRTSTRALLWNNPTLHTPERRKVWLSCDEHVASLGDFLSVRGFLKDTIDVEALTDAHG
ncbi:hypothetical protein [Lapillicoccus sp.]|uniref:hypothetical protein n=1 Tax=Lapillicoccus sp. TaxID=1909287 RepID=UPI003982FC6B